MLDVVEAVGREHERIFPSDLDAHVADAMSRRAPHRDPLRDGVAVANRFEPTFRLEQREKPRADVVRRVGISCVGRRDRVLVHGDACLRKRELQVVRPCPREQAAGVVVVEMGEHHEIDVSGRDPDRGERALGVRVDAVERPPGRREPRAGIDQDGLLGAPKDDDVIGDHAHSG